MLRRLAFLLLCSAGPASAVVLRGHVTTPLGFPVEGARVQLIQGRQSVADTVSAADGAYEIRIDLSGRFLLLTSGTLSGGLTAVQIGKSFYAGRTDLLTLDVALEVGTLEPHTTSETTLRAVPLPQLAVRTIQIPAEALRSQALVEPEMRPQPGVSVVAVGPTGSLSQVFLQGASPRDASVVVDGVSAEDFGGGFNLATLSPSGFDGPSGATALEITPGSNPLFFHGAAAGVLDAHTAAAESLGAHLTYSGDAGNVATVRHEVQAGLVHTRTDLFGSFARFDTSNATPGERFHLMGGAANLGYYVSGATSLRLTLHEDVGAAPLPVPVALLLVPGRVGDQNLYSGLTFDTRTAGQWHNLVRLGVTRKRQEWKLYPGPPVAAPVTVTGANGFTGSGTVSVAPVARREDLVTNREEFRWQTDAPLSRSLDGLLSVRVQDERAADLMPGARLTMLRRHLSFAGGLSGSLRHRLFYQASGLLDYSDALGWLGAPHVGLGVVVVRPRRGLFRGTVIHAAAGSGFREPGIREQTVGSSGSTIPSRSRTLIASLDQNVAGEKLKFTVGYFHHQFSHEPEELVRSVPLRLSPTLAFSSEGVDSELRYQPFPRIFLRGGYTFEVSRVEQTLGTAELNPAIPGIAIGALQGLRGARMFDRPPHRGFFSAEYEGPKATASLKGTVVSRSDGSTASFYAVPSATLLLPNHDLSPGWFSLDGSFTYQLTRRVSAFTQMTNLLDDRAVAPFGFASAPFVIRSGLRIRIGRD